jgi:tRNA(Arg) A34 adenosine deaminase TadA
MNDDELLRLTFDLARDAQRKGNEPFGALLALDDEVLLTAENMQTTESDPTLHAELALISRAARQFSPEVLARTTLYASTEPCAMCSSAIYWSGVSRVVYGCPAEDLAQLTHESYVYLCREMFSRAGRPMMVSGPLLREEALAVHDDFWT